jgi:hypothetical protein
VIKSKVVFKLSDSPYFFDELNGVWQSNLERFDSGLAEMTLQIQERICAVCRQRIYLDSSVKSKAGHRIPLNKDGSYHDEWHSFIYKKAKQIRYEREETALNDLVSALKARDNG